MENDFDVMCDEIYVDYKPIEPSEDYDPIADMLYTQCEMVILQEMDMVVMLLNIIKK